MSELTWASDVNRINPQTGSASNMCKYSIWYMAQSLLGNIGGAVSGTWTVVSSSDGTTADGADNWGSGTFSTSSIVQNTDGNSHSWFTLMSPSGFLSGSNSLYFTIDCNNATTNIVTFAFSKTSPTSGSTTNRPTASDEWTFTYTFNDNSTASNNRLNLNLSTRGDFVFLHGRDGTSYFRSAVCCLKLQEASPTDEVPCITMWAEDGSLTESAYNGYFNLGTNNSYPPQPYFIGNSNSNVIKTRNFDNTATPSSVMVIPSTLYSGIITSGLATGVNSSDSTYNEFPCYVFSTGVYAERKGRLADVLWASGALSAASVKPSTSPYQNVKVGYLWMPWNSTSLPAV